MSNRMSSTATSLRTLLLCRKTLAPANVRSFYEIHCIARNELNKDEIEGIVASIVESSKRVKN